ncbi:MAG: helix-turn-helix transcriptional regulator [Clostridia bacterium]|nr:helix-turn-helix transcriptional regulator [Clostridia bacterium]
MNNYQFGNFLYEKRTAKGLSQAELAAMLGVTNKAVSKWENGSAYPSTKLVYPLARALDVSIEELYRVMSESEKPHTAMRRLLDRIYFNKWLSIFLPLGLSLLAYVLYLLVGEGAEKQMLAISTPICIAFVFFGTFFVVFFQVKNPMCPTAFLDFCELLFFVCMVIGTVMVDIPFLLDLRGSFHMGVCISLAAIGGLAFAHSKRNR